jgi:predicted metal-dependent peptidase
MTAMTATTAITDRLTRARVRLALAYPFLAAAVLRLPLRPVIAQRWCPTAATDGHHIFVNPAWIATLDDASLQGLLAHEVLHVLFAHAARRTDRDARLWNWACDFAINNLLADQGFTLPAGGLVDNAFQGQTAEAIYRRLREHGGSGRSPAVTATGRLRGRVRAVARSSTEPSSLPVGSGSSIPDAGADLVDPDDPRVRLHRDANAPDREQAEDLRRELRADALARLSGGAAGRFESACHAADAARIDWRALLRDFLIDRIKGDWTSYPFSRRHLHRGLFMPSPGMSVPGHIVFAIDTSGSMSEAVLGGIAGELRAFRETFPCQLTVIQADDRVRSITRLEALDGVAIPQRLPLQGRGGTDFRPVFEWVACEAPDALLLYATDGEGSFPAAAPALPVIWLLTREVPAKLPFGMAIRVTSS